MFQVVDIGVDPTKQEHNSFSQIKITLKSAMLETVGFTIALKKIARLGDFRGRGDLSLSLSLFLM